MTAGYWPTGMVAVVQVSVTPFWKGTLPSLAAVKAAITEDNVPSVTVFPAAAVAFAMTGWAASM